MSQTTGSNVSYAILVQLLAKPEHGPSSATESWSFGTLRAPLFRATRQQGNRRTAAKARGDKLHVKPVLRVQDPEIARMVDVPMSHT